MEARGVGRTVNEDGEPGKVIFVEGALPGERVSYSSYRRKPRFEQAQVVEVLRESVIRTKPKCRYFGICGGCSMQHLDVRAQVAVKQRVLEDNLQHLAKLRAETMFRPIHGPSWGYRYRARLAVRYVREEGRRAGRLPREEEQLRRRHDDLRSAAAARVGDARAAAASGGAGCRSATACRRSNSRSART